MKVQIITICLLFISLNLIIGQSSGKLFLQENKLIGKSDNRRFTGFDIELDTIYSKMDSVTLFNQFPRIGVVHYRDKTEIPTEFTITKRAGFPQIMFRYRTSYLTFDSLKINDESISFTIDNDPNVPVTEKDLKIIRLAKHLLSEEKYWNKEDDRSCEDDLENRSYSIYCALRIASLEIENKYNHRNAALQKLRHLIEERYPNRKWKHRLMDFNNMEEINFSDIVSLLEEIENEFMKELEKRKGN